MTLIKKTRHAIAWRWPILKEILSSWFAVLQYKILSTLPASQKNHSLPRELIVSLTSYPKRFKTLYMTLDCLRKQTVKPDRIILWIAYEDMAAIPEKIKQMKEIDIRADRDTRSYMKIIPTLQAYPEAFIVTADDDIYYPSKWLQTLLEAWDGDNRQIVCHRAHAIKWDENGNLMPYAQWDQEITGGHLSTEIFPTGVGGVLYPPGALSPEVTDIETFTTLCPKADDVWLYWMGRRAGAIYKKTAMDYKIPAWPDSQASALFHENWLQGGNDRQIEALIERYGWPGEEKAKPAPSQLSDLKALPAEPSTEAKSRRTG
ncbi:MAG: hypothetical protein KDI13_01565 [Alphaproteobacteria bacterium]|nr:hypothetical protein [Alphaproteobacteria bacterium]